MGKVTNECIVVGNERKLDVLHFHFEDEIEIDTRPIGKITPTFDIQHLRM